MRRLPIIAVALAGGALAARAESAPRERLAVLVLGASPADAELADNLTEVVIARVAERADLQTLGTPDIRRRLATDAAGAAPDCADDIACLTRAAGALGATRALIGSVETRGQERSLVLTLRDLTGGGSEDRVARASEADVSQLVKAAQRLTDELLAPPAPPVVREVPRLVPPAPVLPDHEPPPTIVVPAKRAWPRYAAFGSGVATVGAAAVGLVFGAIAQQPLTAGTREEAQAQFESRRSFGLVADICLGSAAVLGVLSAYLFVSHRHEIFGSSAAAE